MSRFKQLWLSFWRKDQGLGLIEAAVTLPLFLVITFGVAEFASMYVARYQTRDVADSVANFLQAKPDASSTDLQEFVANLAFGTLKNTGLKEKNNVFDTIKIQSNTTMMTAAQFDALCSGGAVKTWANPWLLDKNPANNNDPYYIHVCYSYTYDAITPLSKLTAGALSSTKTLRGKAMAYTYPIMTCSEGQFINNNGGRPVCTQVDASCPDGQYMVRLVGTTPACVTPSVKRQARYRPSGSGSDCSDYTNAVQVGMSAYNKVWCANLTVQ
ncbi:MAG: TadE family protein [bacterium]|jgi:Flp pilus assembly protein TadG